MPVGGSVVGGLRAVVTAHIKRLVGRGGDGAPPSSLTPTLSFSKVRFRAES
jgi:hypothetical protein